MIEYNTCDKCNTKEDTTELVWITAEGFEPGEGETVKKKTYEQYDALCEECYLSETNTCHYAGCDNPAQCNMH